MIFYVDKNQQMSTKVDNHTQRISYLCTTIQQRQHRQSIIKTQLGLLSDIRQASLDIVRPSIDHRQIIVRTSFYLRSNIVRTSLEHRSGFVRDSFGKLKVARFGRLTIGLFACLIRTGNNQSTIVQAINQPTRQQAALPQNKKNTKNLKTPKPQNLLTS